MVMTIIRIIALLPVHIVLITTALRLRRRLPHLMGLTRFSPILVGGSKQFTTRAAPLQKGAVNYLLPRLLYLMDL